MKKITAIFLLIIMMVSIMPAMPAQAQAETIEVTIQGSATKDTSLVNIYYNPSYFSGLNGIYVGERSTETNSLHRALIEFDLSGLPANAIVQSATLTLTVSEDISNNARTMSAYAINNTWIEGQASWGDRQQFVQWEVPGVEGETDVIAEAIGSVSVASDLSVGSQVTMTLATDAVQSMTKQNLFGFKLQMDTELDDLYQFYSSNDTTAANRPTLVIEYVESTLAADDPGWFCFEGGNVWSRPFGGCNPSPPGKGTEVPYSPYQNGFNGEGNLNYSGDENTQPFLAARLNCEPFPRCINDYPVHYRILYDAAWAAAGSTTAWMTLTLDIPGGVDRSHSIACGSGWQGKCKGIWEGDIPVLDLPINTDGGFTIGLEARWNFPSTWPVMMHSVTTDLYLSREPFTQNCTQTYAVPTLDTFTIDPLIETPLGPDAVSPDVPDEQIYTTVPGLIYMVRVANGPWFDGSGERTDAAVSVDGETWMPWAEFSATALCIDGSIDHPGNPDYQVLYFAATTETFMIRVNDTAGAFANNSNDMETPYGYQMGQAFLLAEEQCETQFTYDAEEDWLSSVVVQSESMDTLATDELQVGEWYVVKVVSGTWNEPGGDPLITMDYVVGSTFGATWESLAGGSSLVGCVSGDSVYIQADATALHLRVSDLDSDFENNTGALNVNIYHTSYERATSGCELSFAPDQIVRTDSVDAKQENGKIFALVVGSALTNNNTQTENFLSLGLVPGAWYALETVGGPWGYYGNLHGTAAMDYDMAIAEEAIDFTGTTENWVPLSEWAGSDCNIETDKLGHRMVYFQMPITGALQYKLRVDDTEAWDNNSGVMSWNLYRVIDLGPEQSGLCDYTYSPENKLNQAVQTVRADAVDGAYITGASALEPNTYYAVELLGEDFKWEEGGGDDEPRTEMQLSLNNGTTWAVLPTGALCAVEDGENYIFFLHSGNDIPKFKLRVNSETFTDNYGFMAYNVYSADAGSSINPYDGCLTEGYSTSTLGPFTYIPVADPQGIGLTSTSAEYAEIAGLIPDSKYVVETSRGPWFDGESTFDNSENLKPIYSAEVSSDGGVTWFPMDGTNPDVTCWEYTPDFKYYKIEFTVQAGQVWRIRVADTASARFEDNSGNLAFTLKGEVQPADTQVTGTFTLAGCNSPPIFPGLLSVSDLLNLGNYLAEWFDYGIGSAVSFLAWCPENTATVTMFAEDINTRDPFAMFDELNGVLNDVKNEMNGYNWGGSGEDFSILNKNPAQSAAMIEQYVLGPLPADSPWNGGDLVTNLGAPAQDYQYFNSCQLSMEEFIGPLLSKGVCFTSNWAKQIGLIFYIQLLLDMSVLFFAIGSIVRFIKRVLYTFIGVNLSIPGQ